MKYQKEPGKIHLVLEQGEDPVESLLKLARSEEIKSASFIGIGALGNATLGYFDVETKEYDQKTFEGSWELVALTGNIAWNEGEPVVHAHAVLGGPDYNVRAGHLFSAKVTVTGEVFISLNDTRIERGGNNPFGLKLIELE